jgi:hypothetical protein
MTCMAPVYLVQSIFFFHFGIEKVVLSTRFIIALAYQTMLFYDLNILYIQKTYFL